MKTFTPKEAMGEHCRSYCQNDKRGIAVCTTPDCELRKKGTSLQKIKKWCKECALDFKPKYCTGIVLNTEYTQKNPCPLHKYRFGTNPNRKGIGNKNASFKIGGGN